MEVPWYFPSAQHCDVIYHQCFRLKCAIGVKVPLTVCAIGCVNYTIMVKFIHLYYFIFVNEKIKNKTSWEYCPVWCHHCSLCWAHTFMLNVTITHPAAAPPIQHWVVTLSSLLINGLIEWPRNWSSNQSGFLFLCCVELLILNLWNKIQKNFKCCHQVSGFILGFIGHFNISGSSNGSVGVSCCWVVSVQLSIRWAHHLN